MESHTMLAEPGPLVSCDNCAFCYGAEHTISAGIYRCPACETTRLRTRCQVLETALEALETALRILADPEAWRDKDGRAIPVKASEIARAALDFDPAQSKE